MEELIKRLERVIATGAPDKDGMHLISAETVLEVVKGLYEHGTNLAEVGTDCSEFPNNSDVVGRQKAKNAICNACGKIDCDEMDTCEKLDIPSEGSKAFEWQYHSYIPHNKYCPKCKKDSPYNKRWNFCPNCGADMREVTT